MVDNADRDNRRWLIIAGACLMVLALLGVATTFVFAVQNRDCATDLVFAIQERGRAIELTDSALRSILHSGSETIDAVLDPNGTDESRIKAIRDWGNAQREAERELNDAATIRSNNPLTQPRSC